jgi:hypothetical protein
MDEFMASYVVLKRLTLNSDLGWFKSIFDGHGLRTKQKAITLNKDVMNALWPSMLMRQSTYEQHKQAQMAAHALGDLSQALVEKEAARVVGTIPIRVEIHGPGGKPPFAAINRKIALQDKNWRLNGDFILDPPGDPARFYPTMQEGDLALIAFEDVGWPANAVVVLLSRRDDAPLWSALQSRVSRGVRSMVEIDPRDLERVANALSLPAGHVVRTLGVEPPTAATGPSRPARPLGRPSTSSKATPAELAARLAAAASVGERGEQLIDHYLTSQRTTSRPAHTWISRTYAEHPYDFELLSDTGAVTEVLDVKSTSQAWTADFFMSAAEVAYAATSPVPYRIYRVNMSTGGPARLRISNDVRTLAATIYGSASLTSVAGVRVTGFAVSPQTAGLSWGSSISLP